MIRYSIGSTNRTRSNRSGRRRGERKRSHGRYEMRKDGTNVEQHSNPSMPFTVGPPLSFLGSGNNTGSRSTGNLQIPSVSWMMLWRWWMRRR
jgi:hypothetical protein